MVYNTATVAATVTPVAVSTFFSHFLSRGNKSQKPTTYLSYDEGLNLIKKFLTDSSQHTVEELQRFTSRGAPYPYSIKVDLELIPNQQLESAAGFIQKQLQPQWIEKVGGLKWWQWRLPGNKMTAEWIEMREIYEKRKLGKLKGNKIMFYVHGGAYYFGSVDEHRYQLQIHARKLKARVFAPKYRLAPQFPFPCALQDCLAAYLHLITLQDPTTIIMAGDSAGGGMIVSLMVLMRDQGIPLPAGAILISPWVDLTHSFPSIIADDSLDYVSNNGFHHKPSISWPPPTTNYEDTGNNKTIHQDSFPLYQESTHQASQSNNIQNTGQENERRETDKKKYELDSNSCKNTRISQNLTVVVDGRTIEISEQLHLYTINQLLFNPLVSPVLQPSLGGLPPLLVLVGGGEILRDEQIYFAHKAANPAKYLPGDSFLSEIDRETINRLEPTNVQLQVWDNLCHVVPTLSFTRPAKLMYRSVAQFGAWALARAQNIDLRDLVADDLAKTTKLSNFKSGPEEFFLKMNQNMSSRSSDPNHVGKPGDPLPPFIDHMIRQRVDIRGNISCLKPPSELVCCTMKRSEIGKIQPIPFLRWEKMRQKSDLKFASTKRKIEEQRKKKIMRFYQNFDGENPPPTALVRRFKVTEGI